jgi:hypothetical protein
VKTHVLPTLLPLFAGCGLSTGAGTTDPHDDASTPSAEAALEDAFIRDAVVPALDAFVNRDAPEDTRMPADVAEATEAARCGSPTDPKNCGSCGTVCPGVPCVGGKCQCGSGNGVDGYVACYYDYGSFIALACVNEADIAQCVGYPDGGAP